MVLLKYATYGAVLFFQEIENKKERGNKAVLCGWAVNEVFEHVLWLGTGCGHENLYQDSRKVGEKEIKMVHHHRVTEQLLRGDSCSSSHSVWSHGMQPGSALGPVKFSSTKDRHLQDIDHITRRLRSYWGLHLCQLVLHHDVTYWERSVTWST